MAQKYISIMDKIKRSHQFANCIPCMEFQYDINPYLGYWYAEDGLYIVHDCMVNAFYFQKASSPYKAIEKILKRIDEAEEELIAFSSDEKAVFYTIANAETSSYCTMYPPKRVVMSTGEIAKCHLWTKYRTRKAIKGLVEKGLIERASCGCPAVISYGEVPELVCESAPPKNGYAITKQGFESKEWKDIYDMWCRSMEEWANMPTVQEDE